ncbi:hypothetical protein M9435_000173 [Picochlorum sp. BPE23]|nr:hypothetical protein M9435_000173 [Picochlorum sp. BPE23]
MRDRSIRAGYREQSIQTQTEVNFQPKLLEYRGTHSVKGPWFLNSAKRKKSKRTMASLKQSSSISSKPVETANAFDEALESFQEICERKKSKDDHQTELIQKLLEECNVVDVQGGYAETIVDYSLPKKIRRLPIVRFVVTTRVAMKPETVNRRVTRAVKEHMGETEHVVCPDKIKGNDTETHTFVIVSPTGLKYSLEKLLSGVQEAKDALLVLYNASKNKSKSWKKLTLTPRVCIRFQLS